MQTTRNVIKITRATGDCRACRSDGLCLAKGLSERSAVSLNDLVQRSQSYQRGALLARQGDAARHMFAIRTGAVKLVHRDVDGNEQVVGFGFPGSVIGIDAVATSTHQLEVVALESTSVCMIPVQGCLALAEHDTGLLQQLLLAASRDTEAAHRRSTLIAEASADDRLLAFFSMLGELNGARGLSRREFNLPMSRKDIASYLAMAVETVSRLLRKLQDSGCIDVSGRHVVLKQVFAADPARLQTSVAC
jgi:CRP/FNR family transcriptional regulator